MQIIMTIDDLGLHPAVARAAKDIQPRGLVTAGTVVANGLDLDGAAKLRDMPLGVHLDILRGRPVSRWQTVNSLVDDRGMFLHDPRKLFERYAVGKVDHEQVKREWTAQVQQVMDAGVEPVFLSSHKGVMAWPSLTRIAGEIAKTFGITRMRRPEDCSEVAALNATRAQSKFLSVCTFFDRETEGVDWPDALWECMPESVEFSAKALDRHLSRTRYPSDKVLEIVCRPGKTVPGDPVLPGRGTTEMAALWRRDYESLMNGEWHNTLSDHGVQLCGYATMRQDVVEAK